MIEVLVNDDIKILEDFVICVDWELVGGWIIVNGECVKDDGVFEKFEVSLEEVQNMIMIVCVMLGWVDFDELIFEEEFENEEEVEV